MNGHKRLLIYAIAAVLCLALAAFLVYQNNRLYWESEPWPGGRTAKAMVQDGYGYLGQGIERLIHLYSVPFGVMAFVSLYGAFASMFEIRRFERYLLALVFLWPLPGFFLPLLMAPCSLGIPLGAFLSVMALIKKKRKSAWFSVAASVHNILFAVMMVYYGPSWFGVFGD